MIKKIFTYFITKQDKVKCIKDYYKHNAINYLFEYSESDFEIVNYKDLDKSIKLAINYYISKTQLYKDIISFLGDNPQILIFHGNLLDKMHDILGISNLPTSLMFLCDYNKVIKTYPIFYKNEKTLNREIIKEQIFIIQKKYQKVFKDKEKYQDISFEEMTSLSDDIIKKLSSKKENCFIESERDNYVYFKLKQKCNSLFPMNWEYINKNYESISSDKSIICPYIIILNNTYFYKDSIYGYEQEDVVDCFFNNNNFKGFFYEDLGVFLRSSWEANFARLLIYKNIKYKYEIKEFKLESNIRLTTYLPDFFIKNNVIEIKGFWDNDSLNKCFLFNKQCPQYKLKIIDTDLYYCLNKVYQNIIPNWEKTNINIKSETIPVVGITIGNRLNNCKKLIINEEVFLIQQKDNFYDPNAILVLNKQKEELGYLAKEWAFIYSQKMNLGIQYFATFFSIGTNVLNIQIKASEFKNVNIEKFFSEINYI